QTGLMPAENGDLLPRYHFPNSGGAVLGRGQQPAPNRAERNIRGATWQRSRRPHPQPSLKLPHPLKNTVLEFPYDDRSIFSDRNHRLAVAVGRECGYWSPVRRIAFVQVEVRL